MDSYDVVVVGGGIQGAAVAQAAGARGWSVLLLEQYDRVGRGTSCRSSKLIHGGLRYLESGQLGLVRECLRERGLLLRNAPGLVKLQDFYIPIYKTTRRRGWQIRVGLSLYALLSGLRREGRFQKVKRSEWEGLDGIGLEGLQAVYRYKDGQTDDGALTAAVVASGESLGVRVSLSSRLVRASLDDDGVEVEYECGGEQVVCRARVMVNAGGPWVNRVLECVQPRVEGMAIELVQGTHIVLPGALGRGIYYVEAPSDGRAVFVMPWRGQTLVGTTEIRYEGDPGSVEPHEHEIEYLLETYSHYFPGRGLARSDVVEAFAGLRVLPVGDGSAFARPRETRFHLDREDRPRILSIYGGKLTAYRAMAQRVVGRIERGLPAGNNGETQGLRLID